MKPRAADRLHSIDQLRIVWNYNAETGIFHWNIHASRKIRYGTVAGSDKGNGYRELCYEKNRYLAHRVAWALHHGTWPKIHIDHIDGNKSNNAIANLREASRSQNLAHKPVQARSASGRKGVYLDKRYGTYSPYLDLGGGVRRHLGTFASVDEADAVRRAAEIAHWGEFSWKR